MVSKRVACVKITSALQQAMRDALDGIHWKDILFENARVAIKPNLTFPIYKAGVTTSPEVLRAFLEVLKERTDRIAVVETDGGYGAWKVADAYEGHGYDRICAEMGVDLINLNDEPCEMISFESKGETHQLPLPTRLLHDTDVFVTMPVPKVHAMTYLTLAYKNQWGCVPDPMRLRRHYLFNDAIVAINRALNPQIVLADGTYFLDRQGPMDGDAVPMNLIIAATDPGSFCLYVSKLMGMDWRKAPHLRRAVELGDMPTTLDDIEINVHPEVVSTRRFHLQRSLRNYLVLPAFRSSYLTWLYYESWLGLLAHKVLYAFVGRMDETPHHVLQAEDK